MSKPDNSKVKKPMSPRHIPPHQNASDVSPQDEWPSRGHSVWGFALRMPEKADAPSVSSGSASLFITLGLVVLVVGWLSLSSPQPPLVKKPFTDELIGNRRLTIAPEKPISLLLVGDIMLSRNVAAKIRRAGDPTLPFQPLTQLLWSTDLNVANLESPFSGRDTFNGTGSLVFNAPREVANGLEKYNFKVLSLANNHALDQGAEAVAFTRDFLAQRDIHIYGAGESLEEAWRPLVTNLRGTKIAFIGASYASANDGGKAQNSYVARIEQLDRLTQAIQAAKTQADIVIATMHAGTEYTRAPNRGQMDFARAAIDRGADLVVGHHPHWIQTIEKYKGKYIFYSLGNFIFDQQWSRETTEGLAVKLAIDNKKIKSAELLPVILENYCCPRVASPVEAGRILSGINATSTRLRL